MYLQNHCTKYNDFVLCHSIICFTLFYWVLLHHLSHILNLHIMSSYYLRIRLYKQSQLSTILLLIIK